ncbi:MAG TPA: CocE/NonD family hydrolase, partial [Actinomycetota bacterium]|nr:CocE/NonD family hydrolase [Actinomycetota bacterium]
MHVDEYVIMIDLLNAMTAPPEFPTDDESLAARFDRPPWFLTWLRHQRDGEFWRRGSLAPRYERMRLPALLVGGWYDGYRDSVPRMLERCPGPVKAILGPWNHAFPHDAAPGPEIEWREEAVRWFDHWLRGIDNGVEREPPLAVFVRDAHPPRTDLAEIPGEWRLEDGWPPSGMQPVAWSLRADGSLGEESGEKGSHRLAAAHAAAGVEAGGWWGELRPDQSPFDEHCLTYDTPSLDAPVEIAGFPRVELRVRLDGADDARFVARLCDVAPDGTSTLVTGAALNGSHRVSAAEPAPLPDGDVADVAFDLHVTSWRFPAGHRIRLAISNSCWPMLWPSPRRFTMELAVGGGGSRVVLPVVAGAERDAPRPAFRPAAPAAHAPGVHSGEFLVPIEWTARREGTRAVSSWEGESSTEFPWGTERVLERLVFEVDAERPADASVHGVARTDVELPGRSLSWQGELHLSTDEGTGFRYWYRRELSEDGIVLRAREWKEDVPRDFQ